MTHVQTRESEPQPRLLRRLRRQLRQHACTCSCGALNVCVEAGVACWQSWVYCARRGISTILVRTREYADTCARRGARYHPDSAVRVRNLFYALKCVCDTIIPILQFA